MRFQTTQASCGPAALRNALMARGLARSEDELAKLAGCTVEGTTARGMMRALCLVAKEQPGLMPGVLSERREDIALLRLLAAHRAGLAAILCVDEDQHWVTSFGLLGESVIHVADSAHDEMVLHYSPEQLVARWWGLGRSPFYAILI